MKSNEDRKISETASYGPYLQQVPVNLFTGQSQVAAVGEAGIDTGWTYNEKKKLVIFFWVMPDTVDLEGLPRKVH